MSVRLKHIEIENFKSYRGHHFIKLSTPFCAIIGPNGSGKSNFMDAVCFVMGEKMQSLRVKRLNDLIHGAVINRPISRTASVRVVFVTSTENNEEEISFQRAIRGPSSEYSINNVVVSHDDYIKELEKLHINVKAKNFLVFQGTVESVATKTSKDMTALFEEISGSGSLKEEYEKLKEQMQKAREEMNHNVARKRFINFERKSAQFEKKEADAYTTLKNDLAKLLQKHYLFRIFHNENQTKILEGKLASKEEEMGKIEFEKVEAEECLKKSKKEHGKKCRELAKTEQDILEVEVQISKKKFQHLEIKQKVTHVEKRLDNAKKTLEIAQQAREDQKNNIQKLEEEMAQIEQNRTSYEIEIAEESQSQGRNIQLENEQLEEYNQLKKEAVKSAACYMQEIETVSRQKNADQDKLESLIRMSQEAENKRSLKHKEKEDIEKRIEKLSSFIRASEEALRDERQKLTELQKDFDISHNRVQNTQQKLKVVLEKLGDAQFNKHENVRQKKKREIIEHFKSTCPGVHDRLINLCHPTNRRYNLAATKVIGKDMDAIVVDTEATARQCIQYLKEQLLEHETFLPLNYLKTQPLNERLRNITEPKGVKPLIDVLRFNETIAIAVQYVTKNALVCETPEDAMKVAYKIGGCNNAVSLDGCYYQKSGIISGGSEYLAGKAKSWDEKHLLELKTQKEKLTRELQEVMIVTRKDSEIKAVESHIQGLENRIKCAKTDMENSSNQIVTIDAKLASLSDAIIKYAPNIQEIKNALQTHEARIENITFNMNKIEDDVFSDFCKKIGIRNIRQYEKVELRAWKGRKQKRLEFQNKISLIANNIEYEKSRDVQIAENIKRWESAVNDEEKLLETHKGCEQTSRDEINLLASEIEELKVQKLDKKNQCDALEKEVKIAKRGVEAIEQQLQVIHKQIVSLETKIESKKGDRHNILMQAKMSDIDIPLIEGNIENIVDTDPSLTTNTGSSTSQQYEKEARVHVDFTTLSEDLKALAEGNAVKNETNMQMKKIEKLLEDIATIQAPNMKASHKLESVQEKIQTTNEELECLRTQNQEATKAFEKIKSLRYERFTRCLNHVSNEIDAIYKSLTQNDSAQAFLGPENPEEPYLDGLRYNCLAPGKRFQASMSNLSGGEKTLAALALLFAIHSYQPAPFLILDEIDAALDNTNIRKVSEFIKKKTEQLQTIVISLKEEFYMLTDFLIGICPQPSQYLASDIFIVNLTKYLE